MKLVIWGISILCFFSYGFAKNDNSQFVSVNFERGLPAELPERICKKLGDSYYLKINGGNIFEGLYIINKGLNIHPDNFIIFNIKSESNFYSMRGSFVMNEDSTYNETFSLFTDSEDQLSDLSIVFSKDQKIFYKWGENDTIPKIIKPYPYKVGSRLPNIVLENSTEKINLNDLKGKMVVINWWSTGCLPCRLEIPGFNKLVENYPEIKFISIIYDKENLSDFLAKNPFKFTHYYGNRKLEKILYLTWPRNIILNKEGIIIYNKTGANEDTYEKLEEIIKKS